MRRIVTIALCALVAAALPVGDAVAAPGADPAAAARVALGAGAGDDPTQGLRPGPGWWPDPGAQPRYDPPVPGAVLRGFEPPGSAYGPGHRGVDLQASAHATVRAAADGRVLFAGSVGGTRWMAIFHADGIITSYGPLARVEVRAGERVERTASIGTLAAAGHGVGGRDRGLHFGARIDGRYIDPLSLLSTGTPRPSLVGPGGWTGSGHVVVPYAPWEGGRLWGTLAASSPRAERVGFAVPPNPNHLVLVPGLASTSRTVVLDADHLGYDPRSVTHFSYAGRRETDDVTARAAVDPRRDQRDQSAEDTWAGTGPAAARLAAQLRAQARREPGRAVDLIGHSMGGVVILRYLVEHHDPYDRSLPPIGSVVTIASPLQGSDLASIARSVRGTPLLGEGIGWLQRSGHLGGDQLALDAPAIGELAVGSNMLWDLAVGWERTLEEGTAGALATGTRVLNIGGSRDLVVSSARTRQPDSSRRGGIPPDLDTDLDAWKARLGEVRFPLGTVRESAPQASVDGEVVVDHRVLPGGHSGVLETEAIREVAWRFLSGTPVTPSPGHVSRVLGGELAETARVGVELYTTFGPLAKIVRDPRRAIPVAWP